MSSFARTNNATRATADKSAIFAAGTFKNVWAGTYTHGQRSGERCVLKEFKSGSVYEDYYFQEELDIVARAQRIIDDFQRAGLVDRTILLNTPAVWRYDASQVKTLVEPMIENFEKFNSNTGWASLTGTAWSEAMQALSHFSYHDSDRQYLLCDLQGGAYRDGYILTDPVIMSQNQDCGPADLGPDGIASFFQRHRCNGFCRSHWARPAIVGRAVYPMAQGTSMVAPHLATRQSRNALTRLRE